MAIAEEPPVGAVAPSVLQEKLPIDIALGPDDELLFVEGDLVFTEGVDATAQQCQLAILSFKRGRQVVAVREDLRSEFYQPGDLYLLSLSRLWSG